ncbi:MAG: hypothetical protein EOO66_33830 [Methylobacterium sp.]|nr:MAG: hypothetical protein EOO66_33830 [Methylobacterium sp.]
MRGRRLGPGLALLAAVAPLAAAAQSPDPFGNRLGGGLPSPSITTPDLPPSQPEGEATLSLSALLSGIGQPLRSGLVWRIYEDRTDGVRPGIVARSTDAAPTFKLAPGAYVASVTYGFASATKKIAMSGQPATDTLRVAGHRDLLRRAGEAIGTNSEGRLVRSGVKAGELLRLPEGTYHVVSTYGESNAIQRADLKVENGKVTDATLNHRAATVTLKLVTSPGAEAFAGTAFSVLTPGGDTIREAIGAFPQVTLAEGDYVLIARHDGQVYTREFKVESGLDRDIEVLAKAG